MMTLYDIARDRIAPEVERYFTLLARIRVLESGLFHPTEFDEATARLLQLPRIAAAKVREIETMTLATLAEAGLRPVMQ